MHIKNFKNIQNFTIFEILEVFESLFLFLIPPLLNHSTLTKSRLSEFHRKNIDDQKSCEKNSSENFFGHLYRFFLFPESNARVKIV